MSTQERPLGKNGARKEYTARKARSNRRKIKEGKGAKEGKEKKRTALVPLMRSATTRSTTPALTCASAKIVISQKSLNIAE